MIFAISMTADKNAPLVILETPLTVNLAVRARMRNPNTQEFHWKYHPPSTLQLVLCSVLV